MKFATLSHLINTESTKQIPKSWYKNDLIVSPELDINGTRGHIIALNLLPKKIMSMSRDEIRNIILKTAEFINKELYVDVIQLGALTTSVTSGGEWLVNQKTYKGYVNTGDSYTAAVTIHSVYKSLEYFKKKPSDLTLAIIGAYGIIGEAVSKILVQNFKHSILIGRREEKLLELENKIKGDFETTIDIKTREADVIVTATSHPAALLESKHLKHQAIIIDVSQPPNLSPNVCQKRADIQRIDGGYVEFLPKKSIRIPGMPLGKNFACITEVIMQAMENEKANHVSSIDLNHLYKTEEWGKKYGFILKELTNFGKKINVR